MAGKQEQAWWEQKCYQSFIFSGEGALILSLTNNTQFDFGKKKICNILIKAKPGEKRGNQSKINEHLKNKGFESHLVCFIQPNTLLVKFILTKKQFQVFSSKIEVVV